MLIMQNSQGTQHNVVVVLIETKIDMISPYDRLEVKLRKRNDEGETYSKLQTIKLNKLSETTCVYFTIFCRH